MLPPSKRSDISPFIVMDVMREAAEREAVRGERVLHLEVGQPSTPAPRAVIETAKRALSDSTLGYTVAMGPPELRASIARHYHARYGLTVDPARIVVTSGASGAFLLGFLAAFNEGDRVALATPGYPCYRNILRALGIVPVEIETGPETHFQPTPALLDRVDGPLAGLIVASPANPTGSVLDEDSLRAVAHYCGERRIRLVSDEIYHGITYGPEPAASALAFAPDSLVINSFSKYFSMTGWRLGWMIVPENLVRSAERLTQNLFICAPALSQAAAHAAFECYEELDAHVARYRENRSVLIDALKMGGVERIAPADGAFYLYADASDFTEDSEDFCRHLLADTGVAITPGTDFDPRRGRKTVRLSYCGSLSDIGEAARRLVPWLLREKRR